MLSNKQRQGMNRWFLRRQRKRDLVRLLISKLTGRGIGSLLSNIHPRDLSLEGCADNKQKISPFQDVKLLSDRLILREVRIDDMETLVSLFPTISGDSKKVFWTDQYTLLREVVTTYATWVIVDQDRNTVVGYCGLTELEIDGQTEHEVGYRIGEADAGRGFATEAARLVMDFAFQQGLTRLISSIQPTNIASIRVAEKNGS